MEGSQAEWVVLSEAVNYWTGHNLRDKDEQEKVVKGQSRVGNGRHTITTHSVMVVAVTCVRYM